MSTSTFEGVTVAHDDDTLDPPPDIVPGVGPAARTLAWHTPRRRRRRALDLGTGNGIQALLLAAHCDKVVATDINSRAAAFARANAERNGVAGLDVRVGDLWEPVAGERFDLVVANPPYVLSPEPELRFRDGGPELCARLLAGVGDHLADGGLAVVMANWPEAPDGPWWRVPLAWTRGVAADVLLLRFATTGAEQYATQWDRWASDPDAAAARRLAWLRALGIERVGAGLVVLRRTRAAPWRRALDAPHPATGPCGEHLEAVLDAPSPDSLDGVPLVLAPHATVADGYVRRVPGLGVRAPAGPATVRAVTTGEGPGVADELRRLVALGLVVPG